MKFLKKKSNYFNILSIRGLVIFIIRLNEHFELFKISIEVYGNFTHLNYHKMNCIGYSL